MCKRVGFTATDTTIQTASGPCSAANVGRVTVSVFRLHRLHESQNLMCPVYSITNNGHLARTTPNGPKRLQFS